MGVLFDYFRAPDASAAAAVLERLGGPTTPGPDAPLWDTVAGTRFEPEVMLRTLQWLLTGVPYEELPEGQLLAMETEDGPWIVQLSQQLRDALAEAQPGRLPAVAEQWVGPRSSGTRRPQPRCCRCWRGHRAGPSCPAGW